MSEKTAKIEIRVTKNGFLVELMQYATASGDPADWHSFETFESLTEFLRACLEENPEKAA